MTARHRDDKRTLMFARAVAGGSTRGGSVPPTGRKGTGPPPGQSSPMDEPGAATPPPEPTARRSRWFRPTPVNAKLIYAGYLASLAMPFLAILAALFAYQSAKQHPPAWLATHYTYQLRTFWIGLAANLIAYALLFVGVGLLLFPLIAVWLVARSVKGLIRVAREHPIEEPNSYFV